jgi:hypothetical protein
MVLIIIIIIVQSIPYLAYESFNNISNEAIQNLSSVYNSNQITSENIVATNNANISGNTNISGNANINGSLVAQQGVTTPSITSTNSLNIQSKSGVNISTSGGNGNLSVGGSLNVSGNINANSSIPGAYLIGSSKAFPIFSSIMNYGSFGVNNIDEYYIVLPGYKLVVYQVTQTDHTGTNFKAGTINNSSGQNKNNTPNSNTLQIDNTTGNAPIIAQCSSLALPNYKPSGYKSYRDGQNFAHTGASCQLYYNNTIIPPAMNACQIKGGTSNPQSTSINGSCS